METLNIQIAFFHFQSEVKHQVLKVFTWEVGTVQPMHCRCIFAYYNLSFLLERLIKFIKDTTGLLHCGRARIESINLRFVPNKMERGNDRSDALWQTLIWFWKSVRWAWFFQPHLYLLMRNRFRQVPGNPEYITSFCLHRIYCVGKGVATLRDFAQHFPFVIFWDSVIHSYPIQLQLTCSFGILVLQC